MNEITPLPAPTDASRRDLLAAGAVMGGALAALPLASGVHAAGTDLLKVGLIGCGGRGTGAAGQALQADKNVQLIAMADVFEDKLENSLNTLKKDPKIADKIHVKPDHRFVGFDAYQKVIACCDVVLLCTPPGFRPLHLKAAVEAGKHIFAEKPVAVDAPGVRSVLESCAAAKKKNLAIVSGLCLRYHDGFMELIKRVHEGAVGEVRVLQANDYRSSNRGQARQEGWTDMQYQMRNWYNFVWLSGDFNVEQHVHFLDVCAWAMQNEYPIRATGLGGRQVRTDPKFGHIYDHFSVVYEYASGAKLFSNCRQQNGLKGDMSAHVLGTKGRALLNEKPKGVVIQAGTEWIYDGPERNMYQTEHDELFASIRSGKPINNGEYMAKSTLLAIMGRMAAYTGQQITWEKALNSKQDLSPPRYDWDVPLPESAVAMPGVTKFF